MHEKELELKRNPLLDVLKGYAIFLVVWGHTIQCMGEGYDTLSQPAGRFIYMFHMPLFFFVSGYVSIRALSLDLRPLLVSRIRSLFLPMCVWASLSWLLKIVLNVYYEFPEPVSYWALFKTYLQEINGAYWFIWALLECVFFARIVLYVKSRQPLILCLSALVLWTLPAIPYIGDLNGFRGMYPFFIGGYLFIRYGIMDWFEKYKVKSLIFWGGVGTLCYIVSNESFFIYRVKFNLWLEGVTVGYICYHYLFLLAAGFSGILLSYFGLQWLIKRYRLVWLSNIGQYTLSIYFVQGVLFNVLLLAFPVDLHSQILYFLSAIAIVWISWKLVASISHSHYLSLLLLGKS